MAGNARQIITAAQQAHARGVRLLLTPELALCGYPAQDLLLRPAFIDACDDALKTVAHETAGLKGLYLVVGHPVRSALPACAQEEGWRRTQPVLHNAASVLFEGRLLQRCHKRELPNDQVFDERRYFVPGENSAVFDLEAAPGERVRLGLLICEDAWHEAPVRAALAAGAELLLVINASPFHAGKGGERERIMRARVRATGLPLIYAHLVGGQDELVFDGRSFVLAADGALAGRAPSFEPALFDCRLSRQGPGWQIDAHTAPEHDPQAELWHALVLGLRDYVQKNGFSSTLLGLSGGIDSALVLALAVDALGRERVRAVMMPSPYTAAISCSDAREMAARLGVRYDEIDIAPLFAVFKAALAPLFAACAEDSTEENLQARIRGTLLMALSNKFGGLVLTTGNKSELATGYCTLYGDMAGGFAVIKDLAKTEVFRLARWRNAHNPCGGVATPIPERIISRAPSAELRHNQTDQDSLPDYAVLDAIVERYMQDDQSPASIVAAGLDRAAVEQVVRLLHGSEYKRQQAPLGIRLTHRSFGKDWRYPVTSKYLS